MKSAQKEDSGDNPDEIYDRPGGKGREPIGTKSKIFLKWICVNNSNTNLNIELVRGMREFVKIRTLSSTLTL